MIIISIYIDKFLKRLNRILGLQNIIKNLKKKYYMKIFEKIQIIISIKIQETN